MTPTGKLWFCSLALQICTTLMGQAAKPRAGPHRVRSFPGMRFHPNNLPSKRALQNVCYCATTNNKHLQRAVRFRECLFVHSLVGSLRPSGKADRADITPTPVLQVRSCRRKSVPLIPEEGMRWGGRVQGFVSFAYGIL